MRALRELKKKDFYDKPVTSLYYCEPVDQPITLQILHKIVSGRKPLDDKSIQQFDTIGVAVVTYEHIFARDETAHVVDRIADQEVDASEWNTERFTLEFTEIREFYQALRRANGLGPLRISSSKPEERLCYDVQVGRRLVALHLGGIKWYSFVCLATGDKPPPSSRR